MNLPSVIVCCQIVDIFFWCIIILKKFTYRKKSSEERMKSHLKAKFIADASIPDGTKLQPDEEVNIKDLININVDVVCNNIEHGVWSFLFCQLHSNTLFL